MEVKLRFSQLAAIMACIRQYHKLVNEEVPKDFEEIRETILNDPEYVFYLIDRKSYENLQHLSGK